MLKTNSVDMQTVVKAAAYAITNRWLSFYSVGCSRLDSETSCTLSCSPECPSLHAYERKCLLPNLLLFFKILVVTL